MMTLSQAGLGTGSPTGTIDQDAVEGKLTLDTDKLTAALTGDFASVKALFTKVTGSYSTEGVQQRMQGILDPFLKSGGVMDSRDAGETNTLKDLQSQIDDWAPRLTAKEAALRAQFTAMEVALSKNQSMSSAISGQLASLASGIAPQ
jgi:flagellar hook-associated protein 2